MSNAHPRPWHRGSLFGDGPRRRLDRNQRARFRFLLKAHTTAGRITPKGEWTGEALLRHLGATGQCDPSHATLAANARGIDPSTVRDALKDMHACGLVTWQRRIVRIGERVEQTSNAYELLPALTPSLFADRCDRESPRATGLIDKSIRLPSVLQPPAAEIAAAQAALAQRRRVIEERLLTRAVAARP
jgi:hypothetical protein